MDIPRTYEIQNHNEQELTSLFQEMHKFEDPDTVAIILEAMKMPVLAIHQCASKTQLRRLAIQLLQENLALKANLNATRRLEAALRGMLQLDEENHQRYPGDEDVCKEVREARAALSRNLATPRAPKMKG